jgi:hypothetical protein
MGAKAAGLLEDVRRALTDPDPEVRKTAGEALDKIGRQGN